MKIIVVLLFYNPQKAYTNHTRRKHAHRPKLSQLRTLSRFSTLHIRLQCWHSLRLCLSKIRVREFCKEFLICINMYYFLIDNNATFKLYQKTGNKKNENNKRYNYNSNGIWYLSPTSQPMRTRVTNRPANRKLALTASCEKRNVTSGDQSERTNMKKNHT